MVPVPASLCTGTLNRPCITCDTREERANTPKGEAQELDRNKNVLPIMLEQ
jgi:hypothetical protein